MSEDKPAPAVSAMGETAADLLGRDGVDAPTQLGSHARVGKFEITASLGHGGMGKVFAATEPVTGTTVALKMLRTELLEDKDVVHAFLREAQHMYQLSHPSILKVLEVSGPEDGPFFVMPMIKGGSLEKKIAEEGALDPREILSLCIQIAEGIAHAHSKGLLHRDLKPANILLDEGGRALITDFGLVQTYLGDSTVRVDESQLAGTPAYMSPSVAGGQAEDTRCDVYSFGAMMYEMLCGKAPYRGQTALAVVQAVLAGPPVSLASLNPKAPKALVAIAEWCMGRELRDRYASMNDVVQDLKRAQAGQVPRGPHGTGGRTKTFLLTLLAIVAVGLLASGVAQWYMTMAGRSAPKGKGPAEQPRPPVDNDARTGNLLRQAAQAETRGKYHEATQLYRQVHKEDPGNTQAWEGLVGLLIRVGHLDPAQAELDRWLRIDPNSSSAKRLQDRLDAAKEDPPSRQPPGDGSPPPHPPGSGRPTGRPAGPRSPGLPPPRP